MKDSPPERVCTGRGMPVKWSSTFRSSPKLDRLSRVSSSRTSSYWPPVISVNRWLAKRITSSNSSDCTNSSKLCFPPSSRTFFPPAVSDRFLTIA